MSVSHLHTNGTGVTCDQDSSAGSVVIGVVMGFAGSVLINIGQNLQARALKASKAVMDNPCSSKPWIVGLSVFITGSLLNFVAFTFASASVLVPIEAVQFVINVLFNKYVNHKRTSKRMLVGVALTILGTVSCVTFGPNDARCFTIEDLSLFWASPAWWAYLVVSFGVATATYALHEVYARAAKAGSQELRAREIVMPVSFAISSSLFGGSQMIVHSKAVAELFELLFQGVQPMPLAHWYFWLELVLLSSCGIFWLFKMNQSLGLYEPLFIIPLLQSFYILFGVVAGGIYFEEFATLSNGPIGAAGWPAFLFGMLGILVGLYLIAPTKDDLPPPEHPPGPKMTMRAADGVEYGQEYGRTLSTLPQNANRRNAPPTASMGSYPAAVGNGASQRASYPPPSGGVRSTVAPEHLAELREGSSGRLGIDPVLEDAQPGIVPAEAPPAVAVAAYV